MSDYFQMSEYCSFELGNLMNEEDPELKQLLNVSKLPPEHHWLLYLEFLRHKKQQIPIHLADKEDASYNFLPLELKEYFQYFGKGLCFPPLSKQQALLNNQKGLTILVPDHLQFCLWPSMIQPKDLLDNNLFWKFTKEGLVDPLIVEAASQPIDSTSFLPYYYPNQEPKSENEANFNVHLTSYLPLLRNFDLNKEIITPYPRLSIYLNYDQHSSDHGTLLFLTQSSTSSAVHRFGCSHGYQHQRKIKFIDLWKSLQGFYLVQRWLQVQNESQESLDTSFYELQGSQSDQRLSDLELPPTKIQLEKEYQQKFETNLEFTSKTTALRQLVNDWLENNEALPALADWFAADFGIRLEVHGKMLQE